MKNIFANAKWGDTFRTYSDKKCIFLGFVPDMSYIATVENQAWTLEYNADGTLREALRKNDDDYHHPLDIVGKWEETVDRKKVSHLAIAASDKYRDMFTRRYEGMSVSMLNFSLGDIEDAYMSGYEEGYCKAKED